MSPCFTIAYRCIKTVKFNKISNLPKGENLPILIKAMFTFLMHIHVLYKHNKKVQLWMLEAGYAFTEVDY